MPILKLAPHCKDYLWGGTKLIHEFHKSIGKEILAETWELSCHKDGACTISGGPFDGMSLTDYIRLQGFNILGSNCRLFTEFPVLVKLIDAKEKLSVQVHPNDDYARQNEGQCGKTEMWYIVDADEAAFVYYGFSKEISKEEFAERIGQNTLLEVLRAVPVKKGDVFLIEAGTIHAIGAGIVIAEIQQNSNVTYRVYDYGRRGPDGRTRELHVSKALDVTCLKPRTAPADFGGHLCSCGYFTVDKVEVEASLSDISDETTFFHLLILDGEGRISDRDSSVTYQRGDSLFIPAGSGALVIEGKCLALKTSIPEPCLKVL